MKKFYLPPFSGIIQLGAKSSCLVSVSGDLNDYEIISPYTIEDVISPDAFGPLC